MDNKNLQEVFERQRIQGMDKEEVITEKYVQVIGFIVGDEEFAVPILNIREIVKPIEYTRVPGTPKFVLGVFNLRGNVYPLVSLRAKFGIPSTKEDKDTRYIVVKDNDDLAGFTIDRLTEAIRIREEDIEPAPVTLNNSNSMIYGIGKKDDKLITILSASSLLKRNF